MLRVQDTPATNKYLLEGALAGGPNNGAASFGPASWNQASCEYVAAPPDVPHFLLQPDLRLSPIAKSTIMSWTLAADLPSSHLKAALKLSLCSKP